jgi:hypothetical protein
MIRNQIHGPLRTNWTWSTCHSSITIPSGAADAPWLTGPRPCEGGSDLLNIWVNNQVDEVQVHIVAAFALIDNENTWMYIRMYQKIVRLPILRQIFNQLSVLANLLVERQDRRVDVTQFPKRSDLQIGEKLIRGDGPIIEYRRRRRDLIEAAELV